MRRKERPLYETRLPRAVFGCVWGVLVGVAIMEAIRLEPVAARTLSSGAWQKFSLGNPAILIRETVDAAVYALLILLMAVALWRLLGMSKLQGWRSALALGFVLTFGVWFLGGLRSEDPIPRQPLQSAALFGAAGAIAGLAAWKTAYRRRYIPWVLSPIGPGGLPGPPADPPEPHTA